MAVKKKGLGRGLDALFPEKSVKPAEKKPEQKPVATNESLHQQEEGSLNASAVKSAAETKDTAQAAVVEEPKKSEMLVKISKVELSRASSLMRMLYWNYLNQLSSLASYSHFWFRIKAITMRLLQAREDGEQPNLPD